MTKMTITKQVPTYKTLFSQGRQHDYIVVIPVINEGERLHNLLTRCQKEQINDVADIVIIDGGSTDGSTNEAALKRFNVNALLVKTQAGGLSSQLRCAYFHAVDAEYKGVITIDGNNKDDPKAIHHFIAELKDDVDFIQASRFLTGGEGVNTPKTREWAIRYIHAPLLSAFSGFKWTDTTQGFRAYSMKLLKDENLHIFRDVFTTYELLPYINLKAPKHGYRCKEVATNRVYPEGKVPTKINGMMGNIKVFIILLKCCFGHYEHR